MSQTIEMIDPVTGLCRVICYPEVVSKTRVMSRLVSRKFGITGRVLLSEQTSQRGLVCSEEKTVQAVDIHVLARAALDALKESRASEKTLREYASARSASRRRLEPS